MIPGSGRSAEEGIGYSLHCSWASLVAQLVNNLPAMWETFPGLGRSPGEGKGYPLQYSGPENSMDCIVHGVGKSWTRLKRLSSGSSGSESGASLITQLVKNLSAMQENPVQFVGQEDPLEKG